MTRLVLLARRLDQGGAERQLVALAKGLMDDDGLRRRYAARAIEARERFSLRKVAGI